MQDVKKKIIYSAIGNTVKKLRKDKSQYILGAEYGIPTSILSELERGKKDPQLTTLIKIAESLGLSISQFMIEFEKELPENFKFCDD